MKLWTCFRNLVGVPSHHYDPTFARAAQQAIGRFRPDVVAVELPAQFGDQLAWALDRWPEPVGSMRRDGVIVPWIPGDSIFEACRQARADKTQVALVDLDTDGDTRPARPHLVLPGGEFASRVPGFVEATDAIMDMAGPPLDLDLAREAFMARRLADLMARHRRVVWVGGMAHWTRLVARLATSAFQAPRVPAACPGPWEQVGLEPSALVRLTGRIPYLIARYARGPATYDDAKEIRRLALKALRPVGPKSPGAAPAADNEPAPDPCAWPEPATAFDVARMLLYARNLTATRALAVRPGLAELLRSAAATIGPRYAGRLYHLAMQRSDRGVGCEDGDLPRLRFEGIGSRQGFRRDGKWIPVRSYRHGDMPPLDIELPTLEEARRRGDLPYRHVPKAREGDEFRWVAYPPDGRAYEAYVAHVLRRASSQDERETTSEPFVAGLRDGIDVRTTLRHWSDGTIYVRDTREETLTITNGLIDYSSAREDADVLRGLGGDDVTRGGWVDPSYTQIGSASREIRNDVIENDPCHVTLRYRELSLVTLDAPTSAPDGLPSFYDHVVTRLLALTPAADNLYGWLDVMFAFCAGKPFVYYSRYRPSPTIKRLSDQYRIRLVHKPLRVIPAALLARHRTFRFLSVTREQWDALQERLAETATAWSALVASAPLDMV